MRDINSMSRRNTLQAPNRRNSVPCTVRTSRQRSCNQRVGCLLLYVVVWLRSMIYGMGLWINARGAVWSLAVVRLVPDAWPKPQVVPLLLSGWLSSSSTATPHIETYQIFVWLFYCKMFYVDLLIEHYRWALHYDRERSDDKGEREKLFQVWTYFPI